MSEAGRAAEPGAGRAAEPGAGRPAGRAPGPAPARTEAGLRALYQTSYRRLVGQLAAVTGDLGEAEDVVQEAFARAWTRWGDLDDVEHPEAWLRVVALNLARSRWRRARRASAATLRLRAQTAAVPAVGPEHVALVRALQALPRAQREAIVLHHIADLSVEEVARECGCPTGTVKARLARGRARLARLLNEDPDEPALAAGPPAAPVTCDG